MRTRPLCMLAAVAVCLGLVGCGGGSSAPLAVQKTTWVVANGGTQQCWGSASAPCPDGSLVVAGQFYGSNTFGANTPQETTLTALAESDIWLMVLEPDGSLRWATAVQGLDYNEVESVTVGPDGAIYLCGYFYGDVRFAVGTPQEMTHEAHGGDDGFVARYEADGTFAWARLICSDGYDEARGVAVRDDGSLVVVGLYGDAMTFGEGEANETTLVPRGPMDGFAACFAPTGDFLWARSMASTEGGFAGAWGVERLAGGHVAVVGDFQGLATFGPGEAGEASHASVGDSVDAFLLRLDAGGDLVWARTMGGASNDYSSSLCATDSAVYVTGSFGATASFGPDQTVTVAGGYDGFLASYALDGTYRWVRTLAGHGNELFYDLGLMADGSLFVTGSYDGEAALGGGPDSGSVLVSEDLDGLAMLAARFHQNGTLLYSRTLGGEGDEHAASVAPQSDGTVVITGAFTVLLDVGDPETVVVGDPGAWCTFVVRFDPLDLP